MIAGIRTPGGLTWSKRVTSVFGKDYDPDYGWGFDRFGLVEVGSVGKKPVGNVIDLGAQKVVRLSAATGRTIWTIPGALECYGETQLRGRFLCLMTGTASATATSPNSFKTSKDAAVTLEGFEPANGKVTWRLPVGGLADLVFGNVAIRDANHLVVSSKGEKRKLVLDLRSGATASAGAGETFWCARLNLFKIRPPTGVRADRLGSSLFTPCDQNNHPIDSFARPTSVAGATVGNLFIWAAPDGLKATKR